MKPRNYGIEKAKLRLKTLRSKQEKTHYKSNPKNRIIKDFIESFYSHSEALEILDLQQRGLPEICETIAYH